MLVAADYPFLDILWTMLIFFLWVIWFWTLIGVIGDIFVRQDISGWSKAAWTLFVIVLPILGVLVYLGVHGQSMAERRSGAARASQVEADSYIRSVATDGGAASEIEKAKRLLDTGAINSEEYEAIKRKALAGAA